MIVQSPTPCGIDISIQEFQNKLHTGLVTAWSLDSVSEKEYLCYDRCYRNQTKNGFIPEVYNGRNEYKQVLFNDKVKVLSFFGIGNSSEYNQFEQLNTTDVHLIFFVNLKAIKGGTGRLDEEVRQDVQSICNREANGLILTSIEIGIDNILSEYSGASDLMKYRDLNPYHAFRFNFSLTYDFKDHTC